MIIRFEKYETYNLMIRKSYIDIYSEITNNEYDENYRIGYVIVTQKIGKLLTLFVKNNVTKEEYKTKAYTHKDTNGIEYITVDHGIIKANNKK